jgi:hypothetical protein
MKAHPNSSAKAPSDEAVTATQVPGLPPSDEAVLIAGEPHAFPIHSENPARRPYGSCDPSHISVTSRLWSLWNLQHDVKAWRAVASGSLRGCGRYPTKCAT